MDAERVLTSIEARLAVLEVMVCTALAEADLDLAKALEERFRQIGEHLVTLPDQDQRTGAAGLALSQVLAKEIAAVAGREA